jgi:rod shape-determining protein MreC
VQRGDRLVTFGSLDYVAGVPIGEVTKVTDVGGLSRTADVKPYVSFGTLDLVGVVVGRPATDPGDRVLPPRPVPAPPVVPANPQTRQDGPEKNPGTSVSGTPTPGPSVPGSALPGIPQAGGPGPAGPTPTPGYVPFAPTPLATPTPAVPRPARTQGGLT